MRKPIFKEKWHRNIATAAAIAGIIGVFFVGWQFFNPSEKSNTGISADGDIDISSDRGGQTIVATGQSTINIGITLPKYEEGLRRQEKRLRKEITESIQRDEREKLKRLELKRKFLEEKLTSLNQSYEEEKQVRASAIEALEQFREELPAGQIEKAEEELRSGNKEIAEQLFDSIVEKGAKQVALAAYQSGQLAESRLDFTKAITQYQKAVTLEDNDPDYLLAAGVMARTLGDYPTALKWLEKVMQFHQNQGKETIDLASAQHELAWVYVDIGRYDEAELLYKRSLKIKEKSLGPDHPSVAATLNNLALLYESTGRFDEAELLYKRSLKIKEKSLGPDHPSVAATLNNLALLYELTGRYDEAEPLYKRSMTITKK